MPTHILSLSTCTNPSRHKVLFNVNYAMPGLCVDWAGLGWGTYDIPGFCFLLLVLGVQM